MPFLCAVSNPTTTRTPLDPEPKDRVEPQIYLGAIVVGFVVWSVLRSLFGG
jgi:hypothetical protein